MRAVDIIRKKRDGGTLTTAEIEAFIHGVTKRHWTDYQASALLMAIFFRGMTREESAALTNAMVHSGVKLDLSEIPGTKVDKHSTGGVGDKTSLIIAPLVAACGVVVPMMSGRGLGHTGGTLDKLESIPGFRVNLSLDEFKANLAKVGCAMIGQTAEIAPADKILYALRDVTATVESIPLITASILSKKIAEGIDALVLDVKCGRGAFMKTEADARRLAESLVSTGNANGLRTEAFITSMDEPLGRTVGHSLEVIESIETLRGRGPTDLESLSVTLAAHMLSLAGVADGEKRIRAAISSGAGIEKLREIISNQGGDARLIDDVAQLPTAPRRTLVRADRSGYVVSIDAELLARATVVVGAGRQRVEDNVDHAVGARILATRGEPIQAGSAFVELHHRDDAGVDVALDMLRRAWVIDETPPKPRPLILQALDKG